MAVCTFFGHAKCKYDFYMDRIKQIIVDLIENKGVSIFYSGGRGQFDSLCKDIIFDLQSNNFPHIKSYIVLSYHPRPNEFIDKRYYDDTLYLIEEKVPLRLAILKTNQLMIDKSDFVISGVLHSWGGAYTACEYARRKNKTIISILE